MFEKTPLTTSSTIIFPVNQKERRFSRSVYSEAMTQGRIASADINSALCFFEIIVSRVTSLSDLKKSLIWRYFVPFVILLSLIYAKEIDNVGFVWFWFWFYCIFGVVIQLANRQRQVAQARTDLEGAIQMLQPAYIKKGLQWRIPQDPSVWIELVKEYRQTGEPLVPIVHQMSH